MSAAAGMLGGAFTDMGGSRLVVATLWASAAHHDHYAATAVSGLRSEAGTDADVVTMAGFVLSLEAGWTVVPKP